PGPAGAAQRGAEPPRRHLQLRIGPDGAAQPDRPPAGPGGGPRPVRSTGRRPGSGARAAGWLLLAVWLLTGSVALAAEDGAKAGAAEGLSVTSFGRETVYL